MPLSYPIAQQWDRKGVDAAYGTTLTAPLAALVVSAA